MRTDLAVEARLHKLDNRSDEIPGVEVEEFQEQDIWVSRIHIVSPEGAKVIGRPEGTYVTIETERLRENDLELHEKVIDILTQELGKMLSPYKKKDVLVAGLGNRQVTADSLGPLTVERVLTTRHLKNSVPRELRNALGTVSSLAPGVMGQTGIETGEIISAVVKEVHPAAVIAVDALAAASVERLNTTIQLCDTGICPGAGIGNRRQELSRGTLGVPVLAIGVPTVTDAGESKEVYVTTKDMDAVVRRLSRVIGSAINRCVHRLEDRELEEYLY